MLFRRRKRPTLYVVRHPSNGKIWIGPYQHNGRGYSEHPRLWHKFKTADGAAVTLEGCAMFDHTVEQLTM